MCTLNDGVYLGPPTSISLLSLSGSDGAGGYPGGWSTALHRSIPDHTTYINTNIHTYKHVITLIIYE